MNVLQLSWKNLKFRGKTTFLLLLLFGLGTGLMIFILLFQQQLSDKFEKNLAGVNLVLGAKGSPLQLILCNLYHIDAPTGNISLKDAAPFMNPNHPIVKAALPLSVGDSYKGFRIVGTQPNFLEWYQLHILQGKLWSAPLEAVVGEAVATQLGLKIGDEFLSAHGLIDDGDHVHENPYKVVGILAKSNTVSDQLILTSLESVWATHESHQHEEAEHEEHPKEITSLLLKFRGNNYQSLNLLRNINENTNMQAANPAIEMNRLYLILGSGLDALKVLGWLFMLVSGISLFILLLQALQERKHEMALMRVMGASPSYLLQLILFEGVLVAVMGYVVGFVFAHVGIFLASSQLQAIYKYSFQPWNVLWKEESLLLLFCIVVGVVAAFLPAIQAYRTPLHKRLAEG